jgi:2-polyprenyl-6-methoxyphenol hydroxylase-like FAD-dependent oxidoreductase
MTDPRDETQVLIAGAGPVGTTLAMDLARLGVASIVLERRRLVPPNPRCNTTNARSMELFRRLGCAGAVRDAGLPPDFCTDVVYMTRLNGVEITRYERSTPADVRAGRQHGVAANWPTPEPQHFLSQIFLEPVLRRHAVEGWHVDLRAGWELVAFDHDDGGVTSTIRDVEGGVERTVRSRYLVGCDGSGSIVRKGIGSRLEGMPGMSNMCSTYFRSSRVSELVRATPGWMLRFVGGGILVAIDGDAGWLLHTGVPAGEDPATWDPEQAMFTAIGEPFDYEVIDRSRWSPRAMVATRWRDGNVFLAGDAAHIWVPMGGFGMNAGVADAISLSWRLAAVLAGWGSDGLLDSYERERAPLGETIAGQAVGWALATGALMTQAPGKVELLEAGTDDGAGARAELHARLVRDTLSEFECPGFQLGYVYAGSPVVVQDELTPAPEPMVVEYHPTSWPGARLPHVWLAGGSSVYDRLGDGFTLLRVGDDAPGAAPLVAAATAAGVPLDVVDVAAEHVGDAWQRIPLVLVRPDQHIAWRSRSAPTGPVAADVIATVTGRAFAPPAPIPVTSTHAPAGAPAWATEATSLDGQMRYRVRSDGTGVDQARIFPDGSEGPARPFVHAASAQSITIDRDGGVWISADSVTRYNSAGRATHVVVTDDRTWDVRT